MRIFWTSSAVALMLISCGGPQTCPYKPAPIFADTLPHVVQYQYEQQGQQSLESILFDSNVLLEVEQNICEDTQQEYRFSVPGDYGNFPDSMWFKEAVLQLNYLSRLSPAHMPLRAWAAILDENRMGMRLGQEKEVETGIFITVDRVVGPQESTLLIDFSQKGK